MNGCGNVADVRISSSAEGRNLTPRTSGQLDTMQPK
jgi:cytochrome c